ncbi:MAG: hypothetical protein WDZ80_05940 [Candidatus Paceibacterota bacterium]
MVYGHKDKKDFFIDLIERDQLGHAYIFYGDPEIGKFLFSLCLANYVEDNEFKKTEKQFIDSIIINPEEDESIGIEELREFKKILNKKPLKSNKRFAVINNSEKMTPQAQGSMLKIVEESPHHTTFIFISSNPRTLLKPLYSRLFKVYFERMKKEEIESILEKDFSIKKEKAKKISNESFGRIGRAINYLQKENKNKKEESIENYIEDKILNLYYKNKIKNSHKLKLLLNKESEIKRFNLNPKLQEKVIREIIKK